MAPETRVDRNSAAPRNNEGDPLDKDATATVNAGFVGMVEIWISQTGTFATILVSDDHQTER